MKKILLFILLFCSNIIYSQKVFLEIIYDGDSIAINEKTESFIAPKYTKSFDTDQAPVYKGCEHLYSKQARVVCMQNNVFASIYKNLKYPEDALINNKENAVILDYIVYKDGSVLPLSITYNDKSFKQSVIFAVKEWLKEIKDFKAKPALILDEPVNYSDFLIFKFSYQ